MSEVCPCRWTRGGTSEVGHFLTSGLPSDPAVIERGLVAVAGDDKPVLSHALNTGEVVTAGIVTPDGRVDPAGAPSIDGVTFPRASVPPMVGHVAGSMSGALLPTGNPADTFAGVTCTPILNGMSWDVLRVSDCGLNDRDSREVPDTDAALEPVAEAIRLKPGPPVNLGAVAEMSTRKRARVALPRSGRTISTRSFLPHCGHATIGVFAKVRAATTCTLPGLPAVECSVLPESSQPRHRTADGGSRGSARP